MRNRRSTRRLSAERVGLLLGLGLWLGLGAVAQLPAAEWGSVEGQIVAAQAIAVPVLIKKKNNAVCAQDVPDESLVIHPENQGIANIFVYLRKAPAMVHPTADEPPTTEVIQDQSECRFRPHALIVRAGQTLRCTNSDTITHNIRVNAISNDSLNFILTPEDKAGKTLTIAEPESLPIRVNCDIHTWMTCHWLVVDHPYAAVTDADGKFKIENLPAGEHSFRIWHERQGYLNRDYKVTVIAGETEILPPEVIPVEMLKAK